MEPLGPVLQNCYHDYHSYADDTHLYLSEWPSDYSPIKLFLIQLVKKKKLAELKSSTSLTRFWLSTEQPEWPGKAPPSFSSSRPQHWNGFHNYFLTVSTAFYVSLTFICYLTHRLRIHFLFQSMITPAFLIYCPLHPRCQLEPVLSITYSMWITPCAQLQMAVLPHFPSLVFPPPPPHSPPPPSSSPSATWPCLWACWLTRCTLNRGSL